GLAYRDKASNAARPLANREASVLWTRPAGGGISAPGGDGGGPDHGAVHRGRGPHRRREDGSRATARHGVRGAAPPRAGRGESLPETVLRGSREVCLPDPAQLPPRAVSPAAGAHTRRALPAGCVRGPHLRQV